MRSVEVREDGVLRSSRAMAIGTLASRLTGFLRTVVIAAAIGDRTLANAYNVANVLPNIVYDLLLGGVLTSVIVPLLVSASSRDTTGGRPGEAYAQRLLTLVLLGLGAATGLTVLAAPWVIYGYGHFDGAEQELAVTFARFFLPQILFYGIGATIGAILNTRGRFAAPMWAPVLNNLIVIVTGLAFIAEHPPPQNAGLLLSTTQLLTLAIGTTLGIVVQTVALLPSLRGSGFRLRLRFDFRRAELAEAGRLAGWVFVYVAANQAGLFVIIALAQAASDAAHLSGGGGFSPYLYAYTVFTLPYAIIAVSVITALMPRMSRAAIDRQFGRLRADLSAGLRLAGVLIVPAAVALVIFGPLIGTAIFSHGRLTDDDAKLIGFVLTGFSVGLIPFSVFQLHLRAFYAVGDTRTPALINIVVNVVNVLADLLLYLALPPRVRVVGLAVGFAVSYVAGVGLTTTVLRRWLPFRAEDRVVRTYARLVVSAVFAAALAGVVVTSVLRVLGESPFGAAVGLLLGLPVGGVCYARVARRLRVGEIRQLAAALPDPVARVLVGSAARRTG